MERVPMNGPTAENTEETGMRMQSVALVRAVGWMAGSIKVNGATIASTE